MNTYVLTICTDTIRQRHDIAAASYQLTHYDTIGIQTITFFNNEKVEVARAAVSNRHSFTITLL
jgi:hypothetical protein